MPLMTPPTQQVLTQTYQDPRGFMQMPITNTMLKPQPSITELLKVNAEAAGGSTTSPKDGGKNTSQSQIVGSPLSKSDQNAEHSGVADRREDLRDATFSAGRVPDGWTEAMAVVGLGTGAPFGAFAQAVEWAFGDNPAGVVGPPGGEVSSLTSPKTQESFAQATRDADRMNAEKENTADSGGVTSGFGGSGGYTDDRTHGTNQDATQNSSPQPSAQDREDSRNSGGGEGAGGGSSGSDTGGTSGGRGDTAGTSEPGGMGGY